MRNFDGIPLSFKVSALFVCLVMALAMAACAPKFVPPPPVTEPSRVVTQEGIAFYVRGLRIPGTRQDLKVKEGETLTWIPLILVKQLRFSGPVSDRYRSAEIILAGGERIKGEVFVDFLVEGTTDLGYWNMPMGKVARLELGTE